MSFSDKMRASLGAEGARLEITPPADGVTPGGSEPAMVKIMGGTNPAQVDALIVRLIGADRHWVDDAGAEISEADAMARDDRKGLTAGWTRVTVHEARIDVGVTVDAGAEHVVDVSAVVPEGARPSSPSYNYTLNVQADIKGQIDPTGNARVRVG